MALYEYINYVCSSSLWHAQYRAMELVARNNYSLAPTYAYTGNVIV